MGTIVSPNKNLLIWRFLSVLYPFIQGIYKSIYGCIVFRVYKAKGVSDNQIRVMLQVLGRYLYDDYEPYGYVGILQVVRGVYGNP